MASSVCRVTLLYLLSLLSFGCFGQVLSPPYIKTPDRPYTEYVQKGSTQTVKCIAEGEPQPTYKWMKDGKDFRVQKGGNVQVDAATGDLTINDYNWYGNDGDYMCVATNSFGATAFSPIITLEMIRLVMVDDEDRFHTGTEYHYFKMPCNYEGIGSDLELNWYLGEENLKMSHLDQHRLYVDTDGTLHFTYLLSIDGSGFTGTTFRCGLGSEKAQMIKLGVRNKLKVLPVDNPPRKAPKLEYSNSGVQAKLFTNAILECFFSGYDPETTGGSKAPRIQWKGLWGNRIEGGDKYEISDDTRRLTIKDVHESDEGGYYCRAVTRGEVTQWNPVELDVISDPIWLSSGAPTDLTLPEGEDAVFHCNSRSMSGESPPDFPRWYLNGEMMGSHTDTNKIQISDDWKSLTVKKIRKPSDIMCIQCKVINAVGTTWGNACLNVIEPSHVTITPKPTLPPRTTTLPPRTTTLPPLPSRTTLSEIRPDATTLPVLQTGTAMYNVDKFNRYLDTQASLNKKMANYYTEKTKYIKLLIAEKRASLYN